MSKSIWHTNDTPQQNRKILFETNSEYGTLLGAYTIEGYCSFDEKTMPFDEEDVLRWCYLDDLLALETELERTRKALVVAVDALNKIDKQLMTGIEMTSEARNALEQITELEQKD